jgi:tungstate transport system substrate-binding protein
MHKTSTSRSHLARPGAVDGRSGARRRLLAVPLVGLLTAVFLVVAPSLANADTSSTLTVVGTSDINDSGLIPNLIQPQFQKDFPQFTFKYLPSATGAAIQAAENGTGGPSALIVHAASLENQFVANGFSYKNQYGNAIFTNDFVIVGPTGDPAGAGTNAANNAAQSFADIASAGAAGNATFFGRGGNVTASGTTIEEHAIWALVASSGLQPASLTLCTVSAADGGGMSPIAASAGVANGGPCPDSGTVLQTHAPSWYQITGTSQASTVETTNSCNGFKGCYTITDRSTFDYLSSGTDGGVTIPNLKIVTRDNSASAPGGRYLLINYFHIYIINPNKPGETVNLTAAQDFVSFLTSPAFQSQLKTYLPTTDPGGPPFVADASPNLTVSSGLPKNYTAKKPLTVKGTLVNAEPGYPALAGQSVFLDQIVANQPIPVASAKTDSTGAYSIKYTPTSSGSYEVSTGQISMIENSTLNPVYGDILSPSSTSPANVTVHAVTSNFKVESQGGKALVLGTVGPGTGHVKGTVTVLARAVGRHGAFKTVATERLASNQGNFAILAPLAPGGWNVKVKFSDRSQVVAATSRTVKVTIGPKPTSSITISSFKKKSNGFTLAGTATPSGESGAKVELLRINTAAGAPAKLAVFGTANLGAGKNKVTFKAKLKRAARWVLQLEYIRPGEAPSFSGLKTITIR